MKTRDVTALGEVLIDFTEAGVSAAGQALYERNPGGAPANVAVAVSRLGGQSAFIGTVGKDGFGVFLRDTLASAGVETRGMRTAADQHTTLAFVSLGSGGERAFSFARNPGADTRLFPEDLDRPLIETSRFLHVGSLSLTHEPARAATLAAIGIAKAAGTLVSYDPNWRAPLWPDEATGTAAMRSLFPLADVVKVSDAELSLLFGGKPESLADLSAGAASILSQGPRLVLVTLGPQGTFYKTVTAEGIVGARAVAVADTTGAGDSFVGGLLYRLSQRLQGRMGEVRPEDGAPAPEASIAGLFALAPAELEADLMFANAVASLCVTRRGAIPAMPSLSETEAFLRADHP